MNGSKVVKIDDFFKEGDQLVYAVCYDNGEPYEDGYDYIKKIFSSWEDAVKYIEEFPDYEMEYIHDIVYTKERVIPVHFRTPVWINRSDSYYSSMLTIEIWNINTGDRVIFDNIHIYSVPEEEM